MGGVGLMVEILEVEEVLHSMVVSHISVVSPSSRTWSV